MKLRFLLAAISLTTLAAAQRPIPASFFGITTVRASDYPPLNFGFLAHPPMFAWAWIERARGQYNFAGFDSYVAQAVANGLVDQTNTVNMAITFASTPQWAAADPRTCTNRNGVFICTSPPADLQDWTDFVTTVINHYNGVNQPHIRYYELWNEANATNFWTGSYQDLVNMAQIAYPIIHNDPYSKLLTPSVSGPVGNVVARSGSTWMTNYLNTGGAAYADGGAWHGYIAATGVRPYPMPEDDVTSGCTAFNTCFGSIITKANTFRQVFDQNGMSGKPMFQTEGSWGNGNVTDPDTQVAWLARWYLLQAGLSASLNLRQASWYAWGGGTQQTWGDIEADDGSPTAAGNAYSQVFDWTVGAMVQPCSSQQGVWTCRFARPRGYHALAVWSAVGDTPYSPDPRFIEYRDLAGNVTPIPRGQTVTIGAKPILLENRPQ